MRPAPATKKEYESYAASLKSIISSELKKTACERDNGLIKECAESIDYCRERIRELGTSDRRSRGSGIMRARSLRVAAAVLVAAMLMTGVVITVHGKAIFSAVTWAVNRLTENNEAVRRFTSEKSFRRFVGESVLLPGEVEGLEFVSAEVSGPMENADISMVYSLNGEPLYIKAALYKDAGQGEVTITLDYDEICTAEYLESAYGRMLRLGESPEGSFIVFPDDKGDYAVFGKIDVFALEEVVFSMLRGR